MVKKLVARLCILLILLSFVPIFADTSKVQDPYKTYNLEPYDSDLNYRMVSLPPDVILLKSLYLVYHYDVIPFSIGDIKLVKGGGPQSFSFSAKVVDPDDANSYTNISSTFTIEYKEIENEKMDFIVTHQTSFSENHHRSELGDYILMESTENRTSDAFFDNSPIEGDEALYIKISLDKDPNSWRPNDAAELFCQITGVVMEGTESNVVINQNAEENPGESNIDVSNNIVEGTGTGTASETEAVAIGVGVAVAGAAIGAAGAGVAGIAGGSSPGSGGSNSKGRRESDDEEGEESTYQMRIYKDFGDKIKYGGQPVFVYARMVEITSQGYEKERLDLTEQIDIFTGAGPIKISHVMLSGSYQGASVIAESDFVNRPIEGTISFKFTGEGGSFQNNVIFKLVGEPLIQLKSRHENSVYLQAGSRKAYSALIEPKDFLSEPQYAIGSMSETETATVELNKDKSGQTYLVVKNLSEKKETITEFYETYQLELIAENEKQMARIWISVIICNEGLLPKFHGGKAEVKGYYDPKTKLMAETVVDFKLGLWNENEDNLAFSIPEEIAFTYTDEARICEIIGLEAEKDLDCADHTVTRYRMKSEKPFPNDVPVEGDFTALCKQNGEFYEYNMSVPLMPDVQIYNKNAHVEEEYQNCVYMITQYLPEEDVEKILAELERNRIQYKYGAEDYRIYRHYVWNRAQYYIMTQHRDFMRDAAFNDDVVKILEWTKFIGDIALEVALLPVGGPLASFVIKNAKDLLIALSDAYQTKGSIGLDDVWAYLKGVLGNMEDISSSSPGPSEYKRLAIWLSCFFVYRVFYNRSFGKNGEGVPIDSWSEAIYQSAKDLGIKTLVMGFAARAMGQVDDVVQIQAPGGSIKTLNYHAHVDKNLMKPVTDIGDKVVDVVDAKTASWVDRMCQYLDDVVNGDSQFGY